MSYQSFDGYGVDVAIKRADDLDRKVLGYITEHPACRVLDVGSGAGGQSVRMAQAGAYVVAIDQFDFSAEFAQFDHTHESLRFIQGDMQQLPMTLSGQTFDVALCQRTIHYVSYRQAQVFLQDLLHIISDKLYISVTGVGSLAGDTYPYANVGVFERFGELSDLGKEMFSIKESVCLYSRAEFVELLQSAGWVVDECWESAFGNIKAVCSQLTPVV